jgi:hypothetical protein
MGVLNNVQFGEFWTALRGAYTAPSLQRMLKIRLNKRLDEISMAGDFQQIVFELIQTAEMEEWTLQLLNAARQSNPGNAALLTFSQQFGLAAATPELERTVREELHFLDITRWRTRLGEIEGQVCRVECKGGGGTIFGTGFLLGSDVLITNHHVMAKVIAGQRQPADVTLRFDYRKASDGTTVCPGTEFKLAKDNWLIDSSPPSPVDTLVNPGDALPQADQLDYALLRVAGEPGKQPVSPQNAEPGAPARGWFRIPAAAFAFPADTPLFIVQHPDTLPLKLALDTKAIIGLNGNQTRVRYRTNTEGGSSGSPCCNQDWDLVALHHSGDPNFDPAHKPGWNEGIPFAAIVNQLTQRGFGGLLNQPPLAGG